MLVIQYSRNVNSPRIFLVLVRQHSRTIDGVEEFAAPFLGNSYLLWHLLFSPVLGVQREGRRKRRIERIDGGFSKYPINVRFKPFDVIRSRAVCCHFSPVYIAPATRQNKESEITALEGFSSFLFCASVILFDSSS